MIQLSGLRLSGFSAQGFRVSMAMGGSRVSGSRVMGLGFFTLHYTPNILYEDLLIYYKAIEGLDLTESSGAAKPLESLR